MDNSKTSPESLSENKPPGRLAGAISATDSLGDTCRQVGRKAPCSNSATARLRDNCLMPVGRLQKRDRPAKGKFIVRSVGRLQHSVRLENSNSANGPLMDNCRHVGWKAPKTRPTHKGIIAVNCKMLRNTHLSPTIGFISKHYALKCIICPPQLGFLL